jgi:hypothetical protein
MKKAAYGQTPVRHSDLLCFVWTVWLGAKEESARIGIKPLYLALFFVLA